MKSFVMATDSCADLPQKLVEEMGLKIIPLSVEIEGKSYFHYPDERELKVSEFYRLLRDKKVATTSLANVGDFLSFFESFLKEGLDILYISFSSALSGTYQSSVVAKEELLKQYPERKIITIDSRSASMGQGLLVYHAWQESLKDKSIEDVASWAEKNKLHHIHLFTVDDLGTLRRGGRLSDVSAILGTILRVKPILHVTDEGKLVPLRKARGRSFSLDQMVDLMEGNIINPKEQTIFISHGDCLEEAMEVGEKIKDKYGVNDILYNDVGPVIGAHSGPGTIAIFFVGEKR
jgi:DegV family protein with EDD domain